MKENRSRRYFRWFLAVLYFAAGVIHLIAPEGFVKITPGWVPCPEAVVALTGIAELAGAIGLFSERWRRAAGIGLALYALCVWPANFNHAMIDLGSGSGLSAWYHYPRLAFQPVIIWWALYVSHATNWPFSPR